MNLMELGVSTEKLNCHKSSLSLSEELQIHTNDNYYDVYEDETEGKF